ncbi:hypothetical protein IscW_ISCW005346 [Ixodes scapularis]|uniref:Uncharacterized protein n=1 Tax=Ixodes scapularis TaxID=6945 RepID=B7PQF9_IXOSC|nr:hypothetical protein IscW_ISCW005346 [Ixodes scapularis]|eukprot:XP_002436001.1 hypothetical protein IscW_ISCW005346 [Ixodes scapularis]
MLKLKLKLGIWKVIIVQFMPPGMKPMDGTLKPGTWKPGMTICGNWNPGKLNIVPPGEDGVGCGMSS